MRWLHLTDIHIGRADQAQTAAITSLTKDLSGLPDGEPFDLILITGDLVYSGKPSEYEEFERLILKPLRKIPSFSNSRIIAVPGNHDIDCSRTLPVAWQSLDSKRQQLFFQNTTEGRTLREPRAVAFSAYSEFAKQNKIEGLDPVTECSKTITVLNTDFVCLNSCLFADYAVSDEQNTPAPVLALRMELAEQSKSSRRFVLGHYPLSWFEHTSVQPLRTLLSNHAAVYLHGHLHTIEASMGLHGIQSLGFGATYQQALDSKANPVYQNSFAICIAEDALHVSFRSWDNTHGQWREHTSLPTEFSEKSKRLEAGYVLPLPNAERLKKAASPALPAASKRRAPEPETTIPIAPMEHGMWDKLLLSAGLTPSGTRTNLLNKDDAFGRIDLAFGDKHEKHRIHCISGPGHILSMGAVEAENTRFDTEDYNSLTVVSLGQVAEDARNLALRLQKKKALRVIGNRELSGILTGTLPQPLASHLAELDAAEVAANLLFGEHGLSLQIVDRLKDAWFYAVNATGDVLPESDAVVRAIRESRPAFSHSTYNPPHIPYAQPAPSPQRQPFIRERYLDACRAEFDSLKYAALATVGVKLPKAKLLDVYVPATADVAYGAEASESLQRTISDILDSLQLDEAQRAQLEVQLRDSRTPLSPKESGGARLLYQQHGNVLVLGDPGSGKTCFAKNEILAYCQPPSTGGAWYKNHTPVFVPLAEAAALSTDKIDLFDIAATLAARRGLEISKPHLESLATAGAAAFFFDGLDEVASTQMRASLVEAIGAVSARYSPLGNRFVLTSRPAAVQIIEVPDDFTTIHLRGLSNEEIGVLARKVITTELAGAGEKIRLTDTSLSHTEETLVTRLLEDCNANPGIRRLASNPLLLTLLVMIYANSGPLAAKRHRVYAQAVQTLVSVRNRSSGTFVLSEADLRHRLGHVALSIFESRSTDIPSREEFERLVSEAIATEHQSTDLPAQASSFVQAVAETTGLLVVHQRPEAAGGTTVSFMHHSFFEYYTAIGYLAKRPLESLAELVTQPRWREVIALIAGILGDQGDVTALISALVADREAADSITQDRLLFALDCALECDVPPDEAQRRLMAAVGRALASGPGLVDPEFRRALGERLGRLLAATGSRHVTDLLTNGIHSKESHSRSAFVDLAGRVGTTAPLGRALIIAFEKVCSSSEPGLRIAALGAIERAPDFRVPAAIDLMRKALSGPIGVRFAATRTAEGVPSLAKKVWPELVNCLDAVQLPVASAAARALLEGGLNVASNVPTDRVLLEKCLRLWTSTYRADASVTIKLHAKRTEIDKLLSSPVDADRLLALRLLPWLEREERFVLDRLMVTIRAQARAPELRAALTSLRLSAKTLQLLTFADVDTLCQLLASNERDIRIGACRALAVIPSDQTIIKALLRYTQQSSHEEFREGIRAIILNRSKDPNVRAFVLTESLDRIHPPGKGAFGDEKHQEELRQLLVACEELSGDVPSELVERVLSLIQSFKTPKKLRRQALKTFARIAPPGELSMRMFIGWLEEPNSALAGGVGSAIHAHIRVCRQKIEHVRATFTELSRLEQALLSAWNRAGPTQSSHIDDFALRGVRAALREVRNLLAGYSEFSRLKRIATVNP